MKRLLSALKQAVRKNVVVIGLISLISFSGLWTIAPQPAYAASGSAQTSASGQTTKADKEPAVEQEESYEEIAKVAADPKGIEKEYEKNRKIDKQALPDQGGLLEGAKKAVEKVTGQD